MKSLLVILFSVMSSIVFAGENIHLIVVNGIAEKSVEPNMIILQLDSWAKASTAKAAQDQQAQLYAKVKALIEKSKIKKEDVQTQNFSVNPDSTYDPKTQTYKVTGFRVSHGLSLTLRKTEEAGELIDRLVALSQGTQAGVHVQGVLWDYDKRSVIESSVINEAVKNARLKAEDLAKAAGVTIKAVHRIQHSTRSAPVSMPLLEMKAMRASDSVGASTELSAGQVKINVDVQMEFEI